MIGFDQPVQDQKEKFSDATISFLGVSYTV